jgi:hypothetical protein
MIVIIMIMIVHHYIAKYFIYTKMLLNFRGERF